MTDRNNRKMNAKDSIIWVLIATLIAVSLYLNYQNLTIALPIRIIAWIAIILLSLGFASLTSAGKSAIEFAKESRIEMRKVVWPTRQETTQTTMIVVVMVVIIGLILWGVDSTLLWSIGKITKLSG